MAHQSTPHPHPHPTASHNDGAGAAPAAAPTGASLAASLTWAQALNDARALIVQQAARIKSDAQKLGAQQSEIARLRAALEASSAEVQRLRGLEPQLADALVAREQAEACAGRQRVEIDALETASRELQRMLAEQSDRINEMTAEVQRLRGAVPTDEDAAALESMAALLASARPKAKRPAQVVRVQPAAQVEPPHLHIAGSAGMGGAGLARQQREQRQAEARERGISEEELREQELLDLREQIEREPVEITIPALLTPFSEVAARRAA